MLRIVQTNLKFTAPPIPRKKTTHIYLHHSAGETGDAYVFHRQHLGQGWRGIGYNYVILKNGTIQTGRPHNTIGSHSGPGNPYSIGICLVGNMNNHPPTDAQMQSLIELIRYLEGIYGNLTVDDHSDIMPTACPGAQMPDDDYIDKIAEGGNSMVTGPIQPWETQHIQLAVQNGFLSQIHDPREPICYSELAAIINNFYAKIAGGK